MRMSASIFACMFLGTLATVGCERQEKSAAGFRLPDGDPAQGKENFVEFECNKCHWVADEEDIPAPTVSPPVPILIGGDVRNPPTDGHLVTAIINPSHHLGPGFKRGLTTENGKSRMPELNRIMTVQQMIDLVAFIHAKFNKVKFRDRALGPLPDSKEAREAAAKKEAGGTGSSTATE